MKRFYEANASDTPPSPPASPSYGYPQNGNRSKNLKPTKLGAYWFHMITEEFMAVIEGAGLAPSETNLHQLADIFADFRTRAANAEVYQKAAEAAADRAETAAKGVITSTAESIAQIQAAGDAELADIGEAGDGVLADIADGVEQLEAKLQELIANLQTVGGQQASMVVSQAQEILDDINASKARVLQAETASAASQAAAAASATEAAETLAAVKAEGDVQIGRVQTATDGFIEDAKAEVQAESTKQQGIVTATGTTQVGLVEAKGAEQIAAATAQAEASAASAAAALASQNAAKASQDAAKASENAAAASATTAGQKADAASASATAAKASETAAKASETASKASETAAKTSETNAASSASTASAKASEASASASAALASQNAAKASETASAGSASDASDSADAAAASAAAATQSATNAAGSANTAGTHASNASASATTAGQKADAAAASASTASKKASEAGASATAAAGSASAASASAQEAAASEEAALASKNAAAASQSAASASENNAAASASTASTKAGEASASATAAASSASAALASQNAAAASASAASASEDAAEAAATRAEDAAAANRNAVTYVAQTLSAEEQAQARTNINALGKTEAAASVAWSAVTSKPTTVTGYGITFATTADARAGTDTTKPMNAARVKEAVQALAPAPDLSSYATKSELEAAVQAAILASVPTGTILPFAGTVVPDGFLLCNGAAVSRTTYAKLFAAIGTKWGSGDGSTTFNLPDSDRRVFQGTTDVSKVGTYLEAGLPNIIGEHDGIESSYTVCKGAFYRSKRNGIGSGDSDYDNPSIVFNASRSSSIFGRSSTVQPTSVLLLALIKS